MVLARETLTRQAFDALVNHIVDRRLAPGDPLPSTSELTAEFGISRPVVREALSALQACGFVEIRSGRNPTVADLDGRLIQMFVSRAARMQEHPMSALMEVRLPLEVQAAALAAERAEPDAVARILTTNAQMEASLHDSAAYPRLDTVFHTQIAEATRNSILMWMSESIRAELMSIMVTVRSYRDEHGLVGQEQHQHTEIARAIERGAAEEAATAMRAHLLASVDLVARVEQAPAPEPVRG